MNINDSLYVSSSTKAPEEHYGVRVPPAPRPDDRILNDELGILNGRKKGAGVKARAYGVRVPPAPLWMDGRCSAAETRPVRLALGNAGTLLASDMANHPRTHRAPEYHPLECVCPRHRFG